MKPFKILEVKPRIFLFEFSDGYDLAIHFLRYQEFYESPSHKFRGKSFELIDYMDYYAHKFGNGCFSYPRDFGGFNIPGEIIPRVLALCIPDPNRYDAAMIDAYMQCRLMSNFAKNKDNPPPQDAPLYIIGTTKDHGALNHELSHAFFYLHPEYRKEMRALVSDIPTRQRKKMEKWLRDHCYASKVLVDEMIAYNATSSGWGDIDPRPFKKVFKRYLNA